GARPTFDNSDVLTETYIDGFSGDLYGKTLKIEFVQYLRDIQKFDSVDELKEQLAKDIGRIKKHD
ncbi:MAG: riboflavin kinase, partial [Clostridia bacterium]|nr:riboflavin kinase [Clostridia bacterium]